MLIFGLLLLLRLPLIITLFREFLDEVLSPESSPMTQLEEDRQYYATIEASKQVQFLRQLKKKRAKTIELYGNRNSAINSRKKR